MVNPQTHGLQWKGGRGGWNQWYAPLFPSLLKRGKDRSGLVPWAKAKVPNRCPEEWSPLWLSLSRDEQKENGDSEEILSPFHRPTSPSSLSLCTESLEQPITLGNNWLYLVVCWCFHRSWGYFGFGLQDSSFSSWGYFDFELKMLGSFYIWDWFFLLFLGRFDIVSLSINCSTSQVMVLTI